MTKYEALKLALEVLELARSNHGVMLLSEPPQEAWKIKQVDLKIFQAQEALRKALEQPEQEPVAFVCRGKLSTIGHCEECKPLYTAPPKREWVGLTDDEAVTLVAYHNPLMNKVAIARAVEAKLKEKNT